MIAVFKPLALCAVFLAAITLYYQGTSNSDFLAVYLAGLSYANGQLGEVYPALKPAFDLSYPDGWDALAADQGVDPSTKLYPFIYPPIWAVISSWGVQLTSFAKISSWLPLINASLLMGSSWLGWRITRSSLPVSLWLSVSFLLMVTTTYGYVALAQGQPQILTSFLILLAIERSRAGAPLSAGGCLALAASIKIYPLLLIVIWIARKDWRAVAGFLGFGAAIAVASVSLAGWPLHQSFLAQLGVISNSVLVTPLSYNFTAIVTAISEDALGHTGTYSSPAPLALQWVNKLALLGVLIGAGVYALRASDHKLYTFTWPLLLLFVSFFSPMSWSYHFLTVLAFAPLALSSSNVLPKLCLLYVFIASSIGVALAITNDDIRGVLLFAAGVSSLVVLAVSLWFARPNSSDPS